MSLKEVNDVVMLEPLHDFVYIRSKGLLFDRFFNLQQDRGNVYAIELHDVQERRIIRSNLVKFT